MFWLIIFQGVCVVKIAPCSKSWVHPPNILEGHVGHIIHAFLSLWLFAPFWRHGLIMFQLCSNHVPTVDGRNPAPVYMVNIPLFTRFHACWVVQDFFHQQYHLPKITKTTHWVWHYKSQLSLVSLPEATSLNCQPTARKQTYKCSQKNYIPSRKLTSRNWKWMVGILVSFIRPYQTLISWGGYVGG